MAHQVPSDPQPRARLRPATWLDVVYDEVRDGRTSQCGRLECGARPDPPAHLPVRYQAQLVCALVTVRRASQPGATWIWITDTIPPVCSADSGKLRSRPPWDIEAIGGRSIPTLPPHQASRGDRH